MKIFKLCIIAIFYLNNINVLASQAVESHKDAPVILASSPTIAVIASIVAGDDFIIDSINIEDGCPHHHSGKPSDKTKISRADAVIYIDDNFENFFVSITRNFQGKKYKISDNAEIVTFDSKPNWHFWNNPDKVHKALEAISKWLIEIKPESKEKILHRLEIASSQLTELEQKRRGFIQSGEEVLLLSSSIEPLFYGLEYKKMIAGDYPGLRFVKAFESLAKGNPSICGVSDSHDNYEQTMEKYKVRYVKINGENIRFLPEKNQLQQYIDYIDSMLDSVRVCKVQARLG